MPWVKITKAAIEVQIPASLEPLRFDWHGRGPQYGSPTGRIASAFIEGSR
jgi:hypothetical protein